MFSKFSSMHSLNSDQTLIEAETLQVALADGTCCKRRRLSLSPSTPARHRRIDSMAKEPESGLLTHASRSWMYRRSAMPAKSTFRTTVERLGYAETGVHATLSFATPLIFGLLAFNCRSVACAVGWKRQVTDVLM